MTIRRSLAINAASQGLSTLLSFIGVVIISRLLTPEEIGIFSVSVSLIAFAHILRDFGVANYLIQEKDLTEQHIRAAFTVMLLIAWSLAVILFAIRNWVADFYGQTGIADVISLIAINFVLVPFAAPVQSLLRRRMQFGRIAIVSVSGAVVQLAVTIVAASLGQSYLSMAWGSVAGMVMNVMLLSVMRPREALPIVTTRGLGGVVRFGWKSTGNTLLSEVGVSSPDLVFGRTLGFDAVAYFSRANGLINISVGQLNALVYGVLLPGFARDIRLGHQIEALFRRSASYVVGVAAPMLLFIAVMASPVIDLFFGGQWHRSAMLASVMCCAALISLPYSQSAAALIASGHIERILKLQFSIQLLRLAAIMTSIWLPLEWVVVCLAATAVPVSIAYHRVMASTVGLSFRTLWREIRSGYAVAVLSSIGPMAVVVLGVSGVCALSPIQSVFVGGALFASTWLLVIFWLRHPIRAEIEMLASKVLH